MISKTIGFRGTLFSDTPKWGFKEQQRRFGTQTERIYLWRIYGDGSCHEILGTFFESWVQRPFCCELQGGVKWLIALTMWTAWQVSHKKNTTVLPLFGHLVSPCFIHETWSWLVPTFHKCHKPRGVDCSGFFRHQCIDPSFGAVKHQPLCKRGGRCKCRSRKSSKAEENMHVADRGRPGLHLNKCLESRSPKKTFSMWFYGEMKHHLESKNGQKKTWNHGKMNCRHPLRWSAAPIRLPLQYVGEGNFFLADFFPGLCCEKGINTWELWELGWLEIPFSRISKNGW